ncbi:MAG: glycosyltransferase, partial [Planctomycetota bacterium]
MTPLETAALLTGGAALLRALVGLPAAARSFRRARVAAIPAGATPPLSLLKPLYGSDPGLEENLERTLRQNYPEFEVLFLHERPGDPALAAAEAAAARVPDVAVREIPGRAESVPNPKLAVLARGEEEARFDILVSADADVRPDPLYLRDVANGLAERDVVAFVPVQFGMRTLGARLLALLVDTDGFLGQVRAGGRLTSGATLGVRRRALEEIGGYRAAGGTLAGDAELGRALRRAGQPAALARRAVRCYAPGGDLRASARQLLRRVRTARHAAPLRHLLHALPAAAPPLLIAAAVASPHGAWALGALLAQLLLRAAVANLRAGRVVQGG